MADAKLAQDRLMQLRNEVIMCEATNKEELSPILEEGLQRYVGKYISAYSREWDLALNEIYPIIQNNLPAIFFRNPRAFLKPRNKTFIVKKRNPMTGEMEEVEADSSKSAKTQEYLLNYCLQEIKYKRETRKVLLDALLFPFGVLWHGYKGDFGMTEENSLFIKDEKIFVKRISPMQFIHDPAVGMANIDEARWVGRILEVPLTDFFEDDKLDINKDLIKGYKAYGNKIGTHTREQMLKMGAEDEIKLMNTSKALLDYTNQQFQESRYSKFIRIYEIYLRPTKKEKRDGKKGFIVLFTPEQEKPLRVSDWSVKAEGFPSIILQFNELPDNMYGISDIDTYKQIADQKNSVINLQLRNAQECSKTWVGISKESANEEDIEHVQKGDNTIITFESGNPRDRMYVANAGGGASSELYLLDQRIQKNLEDKSGVTDLKRGFLQSGEESAASVKIRAAGGGARPAYRQDIMTDFLKESFLYINELNKQFMPYKEAVRIVGSLDIEWSDKPTKEEIQAGVDVEIDAISMLPENPEKELQELQTILTLMFSALTSPQVNQKLLQEGKTFNISPIIEQMLMRLRIRDPEVFRGIKPEESQGFASVAELRAAKGNILSALQGNPQIPSPPAPGQDHRARLEMYTEIQMLIKSLGDTVAGKIIDQLIQIQSAFMQQEQEKENPQAGQKINLKPPSVKTV